MIWANDVSGRGREDIQTLAVSVNGEIIIFCRRLLAYVDETASRSFVYLDKGS